MSRSGDVHRRPRVVVVATGGTIAGVSRPEVGQTYVAGVLGVDELVAAVPGLEQIAELRCEELMSADSCEMDLARQLGIARRVDALLADDDVDGVVVTHGTDTMEETAYLLHLLVRSPKPVVLVGAMRPADAPSADGPGNLYDAVVVAASPEAHGLGALVVLGDAVHSARWVTKRHTSSVEAFVSSPGPVGEVREGRLHVVATPRTRHGSQSAFDLDAVDALADVEVVVGRAGLPGAAVDALLASGARGLVHIGPGAGNVPTSMAALLDRARAAGVVVVRASRVAAGVVARGDAVDDDAHGWVASNDLGPWKARILLSLALSVTDDPGRVQEIFDTH